MAGRVGIFSSPFSSFTFLISSFWFSSSFPTPHPRCPCRPEIRVRPGAARASRERSTACPSVEKSHPAHQPRTLCGPRQHPPPTPTSTRPCRPFRLRLLRTWTRSPPCRGSLVPPGRGRSRILLTPPPQMSAAFPSPSTSSSPTSRTKRSSRRCRKRSISV